MTKKKTKKEFTIIRDTREKEGRGWFLGDLIDPFTEMKIETLQKGDYTIEGYKDTISIDRKRSVVEVYSEVQSSNLKRFYKKMEKLGTCEHSYLVIECNYEDILLGSPYSKNNPNTVVSHLCNISMRYGVNVMFAGKCGEGLAFKLFWSFLRHADLVK